MGDGRQVLEALDRENFDLILMDVQMPEMDGLEATRRVREKEASTGGRIPIVAMTAHAMETDMNRCLAAGMDTYVSKPINIDDFYSTIEALARKVAAEEDEPVPAEEGEPVINQNALCVMVDDDNHLLKDLIEIFLSSFPERLVRIRRAH